MDSVTIDNFRATSSSLDFKQTKSYNLKITSNKRSDKRFIKGPIPLTWLLTASGLPGKALEISMVLWFLKGVKNNNAVKLNSKLIKSFGVSRSTLYRGLAEMEKAGLIIVKRQIGRSPMVTIITN